LAAPTPRIWSVIRADESVFDLLLNFPRSRTGLNAKFVGHFTRILARFLAESDGWISIHKSAIVAIVLFAIDHIDVLAYRSLLCEIMTECQPQLDLIEYPISTLVTDVLKVAAAYLLPETIPKYDPASLDRDSLVPPQRERVKLWADRLGTKSRAQVAIKEPPELVPVPPWAGHADGADRTVEVSERGGNVHGREDRHQRRKDLAGGSRASEKDADLKAFLFLSALRHALSENGSIWKIVQSAAREFEVIQLLLICGIYARPSSMSANIAFGLLKAALYGSPETEKLAVGANEEVDPLPMRRTAELLALIDSYAQDFEFRVWPTAQMRDALPLFWEHRYPHIRSVGRGPVMCPLGTEDDPDDVELALDGMTPLELYGRYLLDDPPLSERLCVHLQDVLFLYDRESQILRTSDAATERAVLEQDSRFLGLMVTPLLLGERVARMNSLPDVIARVPPRMDCRTALSGWALWFAAFSAKTEFLMMTDAPLGEVLDTVDCLIDTAQLDLLLSEYEVKRESLNCLPTGNRLKRLSQQVIDKSLSYEPPSF
jgi:hypothetical protein